MNFSTIIANGIPLDAQATGKLADILGASPDDPKEMAKIFEQYTAINRNGALVLTYSGDRGKIGFIDTHFVVAPKSSLAHLDGSLGMLSNERKLTHGEGCFNLENLSIFPNERYELEDFCSQMDIDYNPEISVLVVRD